MRGRYLFGHGGGKPGGKEGEPTHHPRDEQSILSVLEHDEAPRREAECPFVKNRDIRALTCSTKDQKGHHLDEEQGKAPSGGGAYNDVREHPRRGFDTVIR